MDPEWTFTLPDNASFAAGASFLTTYLTAFIPLHHQVRVTPASTVLVHAGSGGVGCAAIQLAKHLGARVIATASSDEKRAFALEVGADEALGYDEIDGLRVDVVIDPVGGDVFTRSLPLLNPLGAIVAIGFAGGLWTDPSVQWLVGRNASVVGIYLGRLMKLQPRFVHDCADRVARAVGRRPGRSGRRVDLPARRRRRGTRIDRVAAARREGGARAVKALVTGGEGGLGRAMRARLERRGLRGLIARPGHRVRRHRPGRVGERRGGRPRLSQRRHPHGGHRPSDAVVRRLPAGGLGERRRRRARRAPARAGDGRRNDRRDCVARRSRRNAARCDLFPDEACGRRVRAQHRSADRPDQDQRDLSRDRRHADARPARSARDVRSGRVSPAPARPRSPTRCGSPRRAGRAASAGSSSRAAHPRRFASRTSRGRAGRERRSASRRSAARGSSSGRGRTACRPSARTGRPSGAARRARGRPGSSANASSVNASTTIHDDSSSSASSCPVPQPE